MLFALLDEGCVCYCWFARGQFLVLTSAAPSCCHASAGAVFVVLFALPAIGLLLSGDTSELISHLVFNAGQVTCTARQRLIFVYLAGSCVPSIAVSLSLCQRTH